MATNGKVTRVGIVGFGWAAGAHVHAFNSLPNAKVVAVCSRRALDRKQLEAQFHVPLKMYDDYAAMLRDPEIDVIDITTEPSLHASQAIAAAEAKKHVLIEKPLALSWKDCLAIQRAVKKNKVRAAVCFEVRFSQQFTLLRSVVDRGLVGDIHYAEVDYYHGIGPWYGQYPWNITRTNGGSSLLSAGCHALDALLMLVDGKVTEVHSLSTQSKNKVFAAYEYPTTSVTLLKFDSGAVAKVASVIDCLQPYYFHVHLVGSEGSLLDNRLYTDKLKGLKKQWATLPTALIDSGDVNDHPYAAQFQEFVNAIQQNRPMALTDLDIALESFRVLFAADESARTGKPVWT
jgi:predicted dehydrogenase